MPTEPVLATAEGNEDGMGVVAPVQVACGDRASGAVLRFCGWAGQGDLFPEDAGEGRARPALPCDQRGPPTRVRPLIPRAPIRPRACYRVLLKPVQAERQAQTGGASGGEETACRGVSWEGSWDRNGT